MYGSPFTFIVPENFSHCNTTVPLLSIVYLNVTGFGLRSVKFESVVLKQQGLLDLQFFPDEDESQQFLIIISLSFETHTVESQDELLPQLEQLEQEEQLEHGI